MTGVGEFMRKLATIRNVDEIRPIEGADAIELAAFGGWQVVVRRAQFFPILGGHRGDEKHLE